MTTTTATSYTPELIALLVGTVIPAVTALVTKATASPKIKAAITAGFAALTGVLTTALSSPPAGVSAWEQLIGTALLAWIASSAAYYSGWRPSGGTRAIANRSAEFGVGPPTPPQPG